MRSATPGWMPALLAVLAGLALISGCTSTTGWLDRGGDEGTATRDVDGADVSGYLRTMRDLAAGDPATKAEVFARVDDAFLQAPTTTNRLHLALALATPGHAGADAERAREMLTGILARSELLLPAEVTLAELQLEVVEQRLLLKTENRQLRSQYERAADDDRQRLEQQLAAARAENRELARALEEAEEKLRAITTIERSIRERSDADEQR
ncbi:hypothetical protein [Lentisalinibacter sediminis]|uniref:hypothetical protein n=1 Tax=Lentisalinibacter sediminis TaxID=2992237 RepID=UPI003865872A